jgi:phenol 2-monooxygenase (NADPH)
VSHPLNLTHTEASLDFPSTGRFRLLVLTSSDLLSPSGISSTSLSQISNILSRFPSGVIELVVLHPLEPNTFDWNDIHDMVKRQAEMRFYNGTELEDTYKVYGVDRERGAVAVVRPDGYIGTIAKLEDTERIRAYLGGCLRQVGVKAHGTHQ